MNRIFTLIIIFLAINISSAQKLVDVNFKFTLSALDVSSIVGGLTVPYGVDLYKVTYMTPDVNGDDHIASGLLIIPKDETTAFPLACYQHGTVDDRFDVPSELAGGYQLAMVFSAFGYVVCAPDFVGLGDSPGIHPYVHAETEASAAIDMLRAVREIDNDDQFSGLTLNDQLFISGYSQGGHAAMAAHREIETNLSNEFTVTACAPMSGPYSISDKMVEFTLGDSEYGTVAYLATLTLGYQLAYPELFENIALEDIFEEAYLGDILKFKNEEISLFELNDILIDSLISRTGKVLPKSMIKPDILDAVFNDPNHPFSQALADNDTYDWAPKAPTNLYYCVGDDQVTFENATLAEQVMNANGATAVSAIQLDGTSSLDHGGCVAPAATSAVFFFGGFQQLLSSVDELLFDANTKVYYANGLLNIDIPFEREGEWNLVSVFTQTGQKVFEQYVDKGKSQLDVQSLNAGMYIITLRDGDQLYKTEKFIKF